MCITSLAYCSDISFTGSPSSIKPFITDSLALRCGVADGAPTGTSGIIGKRDVISTDHALSRTTSFGHTSSDISKRDVKTSDIVTVGSITIAKNNVDVAAVTVNVAAKVFNNTGGVHVTGNVTASGAERGFLQVTWDYPVSSLSGSYQCVVTGYDVDGHLHTLTETVDVDDNEVTLSDIVSYVHQLKLDNEQQKLTNEQQKQIIGQQTTDITQLKLDNEQQKQVIGQQTTDITQLKLDNAQQKQVNEQQKQVIAQQTTDITYLKTKVDTKVIFSAYLSKDVTVSNRKIVVFDKLRTSLGGGYNTSTGIFTSPVAGYYMFEIHVMGQQDKAADFLIYHNNNYVGWALADDGFDHNTGSASLTLLLQKGDTVKVTASGPSYPEGRNPYGPTTFSGYLIDLV